MKKRRFDIRWLMTVAWLIPLSGCCSDCGYLFCGGCPDIASGAIPKPVGTAVSHWTQAHAEIAEQDDFVIYQHEWAYEQGGAGEQLGPFGTRHMAMIGTRMLREPNIVRIEPSGNATLDAARRQVVVQSLTERGIVDAGQRVFVESGAAEGILGQESPNLTQGYLLNGVNRGGGGGAGGGGVGGRGGGGFGGAGGGMNAGGRF